MSLQATVETLDGVPEELHGFYEQTDNGYRLAVEGVEFPDEVAGLRSALDKERAERKKLEKARKALPDGFDPEEYQRLKQEAAEREEQKAREAGKWDELRDKLKNEHAAEIERIRAELKQKDGTIHEYLVGNELSAALDAVGVDPRYKEDAIRALRERKPEVEEKDGTRIGVFPDELHGSKPIREFVAEWAKTDEAAKYMPPSGAAGGGSTGRAGAGGAKSKTLADMSEADKRAFIAEHGYDAFREKVASELG